MTDQDAHSTADELDALVASLLDCGGPLSQIISSMHAFESSGLSSPDAPPVIEVAHSVIRSVLGGVSERYSEQEIRVCAEIVEQVTTAICEEIFLVPPAEIHRIQGGPSGRSGRKPGRRSSRRHRR